MTCDSCNCVPWQLIHTHSLFFFCRLTCWGLLAGRGLQLLAVEFGWVLIVTDVCSGHRIHIQTHATQHTRITGGHSVIITSGSGSGRGRSSSSSDSNKGAVMERRDKTVREANQWCYRNWSSNTRGDWRMYSRVNVAVPYPHMLYAHNHQIYSTRVL